MSLENLIHFSFSKKEFCWGFGSNYWVTSHYFRALAPDAILRKRESCFLMWDAASICVKKMLFHMGHGSLQVLSPFRSTLSVITLVERNSGRENPKPNPRQQDVTSLIVVPFLVDQVKPGGHSVQRRAGQTGTGLGLCTTMNSLRNG